MMSEQNTMGEPAVCAPKMPDFEQIIDDIQHLSNRLKHAREGSVIISDALIGVQNTGNGYDGSVKPVPPDYFVIRCFDELNQCKEEVERIESINSKLLNSIKVE